MHINKNWTLFYSSIDVDLDKVESCKHFCNVNLPTLFETELAKNKVLGNPYFSTNNWEYQRFENYHQYYYKKFSSKYGSAILRLNGIDTIADIFVNGVMIGKTDNAYLSFDFELKNLKKKDNVIIVHIYPSVAEGLKHDFREIRQCAKYNFEGLYIRKPASSFGWDILPRTPLGGIYKDVELLYKKQIIENIDIESKNVSRQSAELVFDLPVVEGVEYKINGNCKDSNFTVKTNGIVTITISNPYLWTIRGYGEQHLYNITISAFSNGIMLCKKSFDYGIRKVELKRSSTVNRNGCFEFYINNEKVFLLGSNWVPVEAIKHIDNKRALKALDMLIDLNCNAIRIWGGGTYETEEVYKYCDKYGIFIWQDVMMGCATYPQDKEFCKSLEKEVTEIVKKLKYHPSICLWAGDNENDLASACWAINKDDPNKNILTREIIPNVLAKYDCTRPYLPSSPFMDEYAYSHRDEMLSEDHLWGPRDYFKGEYYRTAYPYFTSETGYHGLNSPKSLKKFMKNPWPLFNENGEPTKEYLCHGVSVKDDLNSPYAYRTKLMADQVATLFINKFDNIEDFSLASQISQAEAMKFFIEKMRRDLKRNGGIIWWNILDGWPQVSDAIVDYYFDKKLAYYYIKKAQQDELIYAFEKEDKIDFYVSNLTSSDDVLSYSIIDAFTNEKVLSGSVNAKARTSEVFDTLDNDGKQRFLIIKYKNKKGIKFSNLFYTNIINIDFYNYVKVLKDNSFFKK